MIRYIFRLNKAMSSEQVTSERFAKNICSVLTLLFWEWKLAGFFEVLQAFGLCWHSEKRRFVVIVGNVFLHIFWRYAKQRASRKPPTNNYSLTRIIIMENRLCEVEMSFKRLRLLSSRSIFLFLCVFEINCPSRGNKASNNLNIQSVF